jgi:hypothetical protein
LRVVPSSRRAVPDEPALLAAGYSQRVFDGSKYNTRLVRWVDFRVSRGQSDPLTPGLPDRKRMSLCGLCEFLALVLDLYHSHLNTRYDSSTP